MKVFSFEKLIVWQKAKNLVKFIYHVTQTFPKEERFGLTSQLRRSICSVTDNLAEGSGRRTGKDKTHYSGIAYSSLMEALNQSIIAYELGMLKEEDYWDIRAQVEEISRMLTGLRDAQLGGEGSLGV